MLIGIDSGFAWIQTLVTYASDAAVKMRPQFFNPGARTPTPPGNTGITPADGADRWKSPEPQAYRDPRDDTFSYHPDKANAPNGSYAHGAADPSAPNATELSQEPSTSAVQGAHATQTNVSGDVQNQFASRMTSVPFQQRGGARTGNAPLDAELSEQRAKQLVASSYISKSSDMPAPDGGKPDPNSAVERAKYRRGIANNIILLCICIVLCFWSVAMYTSKAGFFFVDLIDHYTIYAQLIAACVETAALGWLMPCQRMLAAIASVVPRWRNAENVPRFFSLQMRYIGPGFLLFLMGATVFNEFNLNSDQNKQNDMGAYTYQGYPAGHTLLGWLMVLLPSSFLIPRRRASTKACLEVSSAVADVAGVKSAVRHCTTR